MSDFITFDTNEIVFGKQSNPAPAFKCSGFGLGELIKDMHNPVGLEIGCDIGDTAQFLLESNPTLYLYSIDPYDNYVDWKIGVTYSVKSVPGLSAELAAVGTNIDANAQPYKRGVETGAVFTLNKTF